MGYNNYNYKGHSNPNRVGGNRNSGKNNVKPVPELVKNFYNPYAFVPFTDQVYELTEEEQKELEFIQDVPVDGSLSGRIRVDFESVTPFCVKASGNSFLTINGQYVVPGSSIKGMVRSVFEILTYANARNGIDNSRYSMRDLRSSDYKLKTTEDAPESGFLIKLNGKYYIQPCESRKMSYEDIERETHVEGLKKGKTVSDKYRIVKPITPNGRGMWFFSSFMNNKKHEYLFNIPKFSKEKMIPIKDSEWHDFLFIHENENDNKNWKYWRGLLKNYSDVLSINPKGIAPCFFRRKKEENEVKDLGFSYLYRQPYEKAIHEFLPSGHQKADGIDLAQAVFGYVNRNKALKGRVQFGNSLIASATPLSTQVFVLGSPKPTYYPFYLMQDNAQNGKLNTYFSNSILSGTKRYLLHQNAKQNTEMSNNVNTAFVPLDRGTIFTTYISFHNLHDYELGALLAAITFCQDKNCHHSLGYAKPFGYGRIKVNDCVLEECIKTDISELISTFIAKLSMRCGISKENWEKSVNSLFAIAKGNYSEKEIRYPEMPKKEFESIKNKKCSLSDFSPKL